MSAERNAPCPCGSGRKYKRCCYLAEHAQRELQIVQAAEDARERRLERVAHSVGTTSKTLKALALLLAAAEGHRK